MAISQLSFQQSASAYIILQKAQGSLVTTGNFQATLRFHIKEDDDDIGYDDDYPVEGFSISTRDYVYPRGLPGGQFKASWEALSATGFDVTTKLSLQYKSLDQAVEGIINVLNMHPCDDTATVDTEKRSHNLMLSGIFVGGVTVLVKAIIGMDPNHGCLMKLSARSSSEAVAEAITKAMD